MADNKPFSLIVDGPEDTPSPAQAKDQKPSQEPTSPIPRKLRAKRNHHLPFKPFNRVYGVKLMLEDQREVQYDIHVQCFREIRGGKYQGALEWIVDKQEVFINQEMNRNTIDDLALQCMQPIYPMALAINRDGTVADILNHPTIVERLKAKESTLNRLFGGEHCNRYMQRIKKAIQDKDTLMTLFDQDWFYSLFFARRANFQGDLELKNVHHRFPITPYRPGAEFQGCLQLDEYLHTLGTIKTSYRAEEAHTIAPQQPISAQAKYQYHPDGMLIKTIYFQATRDYFPLNTTVSINHIADRPLPSMIEEDVLYTEYDFHEHRYRKKWWEYII